MRKTIKTLIAIVIMAALTASAFHDKSANAANLQSPKSTGSSVKTVNKRVITPNKARNFLNGLDMPTKNYENVGQPGHYGAYEADSFSFLLETRDSDRFNNNLTYSVFGDKYIARAVELNLSVNDLSFSSNAIGELIKYSDYLMYKVTGKKLTPQMQKAMQSKKTGEWVVNGYKIKLKKEIFPYEKPVKGVESTSDPGAFSLMFIIEL